MVLRSFIKTVLWLLWLIEPTPHTNIITLKPEEIANSVLSLFLLQRVSIKPSETTTSLLRHCATVIIRADGKTYKSCLCLCRANEGIKFTFYLICQHEITILIMQIYINTILGWIISTLSLKRIQY